MPTKDGRPDSARLDRVVAEARRSRAAREKTYREQALKLYPWVCGRCAREFTHANVRELTVHHRDHDHSNNPVDGSNWELLCMYCHDNEHQRHLEAQRGNTATGGGKNATATFNPFAEISCCHKISFRYWWLSSPERFMRRAYRNHKHNISMCPLVSIRVRKTLTLLNQRSASVKKLPPKRSHYETTSLMVTRLR